MKTVRDTAEAARAASEKAAFYDTETKNGALRAMADALEARAPFLLEANGRDMEAARQKGMDAPMLDRLLLTEERIRAMAEGVRQVAGLPDPVGEVMDEWTGAQGIRIRRVRVPMGVIAMIYEARPNVTVDAAALCFKAGSAAVLRSSASCRASAQALTGVMRDALSGRGLEPDCVCLVEDPGHGAVDELLKLRGLVDLAIPRGGAGLIRSVVENATVPVLETGAGNCHVYVDESADYAMAERIVLNAKTQRTGVCNAAETLLVHEAWARRHLRALLDALRARDVELHGDAASAAYAGDMIPAGEDDWKYEYLRLAMAVKLVPGTRAAVDHINRYGTKHTECIITEDPESAAYFQRHVDAAVVDWNASTRFTDGFEFGFGAEIGISTQKLHARGPMGLREITSYKYLVTGTGQARE